MTTTSNSKTVLSGVGHQLQSDERALQSCFNSMNEAFEHVGKVKSAHVLRDEILAVMEMCNNLRIAAEDAYSQND